MTETNEVGKSSSASLSPAPKPETTPGNRPLSNPGLDAPERAAPFDPEDGGDDPGRGAPLSAVLAQQVDAQITRLIEAIQPGWNAPTLGTHLDTLLHWLAGDAEMAVCTLDLYLQRLNERLRECGYPTPTLAQWRTRLQAFRRARRTEAAPAGLPEAGGPSFVALSQAARTETGPASIGIWQRGPGPGGGRLLGNFEVVLDEDVEVQDEFVPSRRFLGRLRLASGEAPFAITSDEYANDRSFREALYRAGGPGIQVHGDLALLRNAVAELNPGPARRRVTHDFGWLGDDGAAFLVPGGRITAAGFQPAGPGDLQVDLADLDLARSLGLRPLDEPTELQFLRRHIVEDWLASHDRRVTYALLGTAAAALLASFAPDLNRYYLWLRGPSCSGKTFQASLAQHLFGDFSRTRPGGSAGGRTQTWAATPNHIQQTGYYFRSALYLVDDYKPNAVSPAHHPQIIRLLQTYADGTGRGRLRSDSSFLGTRPIRGLLLSTGEDVPEHSASTLARGIVLDVPSGVSDLERGRRCRAQCRRYHAWTADLVRWLIVHRYPGEYDDRVRELLDRYHAGVEDRHNGLRLAGNLAQLAAGFQAVAAYLADVWDKAATEVQRFLEEDLRRLRDALVAQVREQQAGEIFLHQLTELLDCHEVRVEGNWASGTSRRGELAPVIGRLVREADCPVLRLSIGQALGAVQSSLRRQNRPLLGMTERGLIDELRRGGHLLPGGSMNVRVEGQQMRCLPLNPAAVGLAPDGRFGGRHPVPNAAAAPGGRGDWAPEGERSATPGPQSVAPV